MRYQQVSFIEMSRKDGCSKKALVLGIPTHIRVAPFEPRILFQPCSATDLATYGVRAGRPSHTAIIRMLPDVFIGIHLLTVWQYHGVLRSSAKSSSSDSWPYLRWRCDFVSRNSRFRRWGGVSHASPGRAYPGFWPIRAFRRSVLPDTQSGAISWSRRSPALP